MNTIDPGVTGRAVFTVAEFCHEHHISIALYYKLRKAGLGPREMAVGRRRLISAESAAEWRHARERA